MLVHSVRFTMYTNAKALLYTELYMKLILLCSYVYRCVYVHIMRVRLTYSWTLICTYIAVMRLSWHVLRMQVLMRFCARESASHVFRIRVSVNVGARELTGSRLIGYKSQHVRSIHLAVHYPDENVYRLDLLPNATVAILIIATTCPQEE